MYSNFDEWIDGGEVGSYLWDAIALIHTVKGESAFSCSDIGFFTIGNGGRTTFVPDAKGNAHIIQTLPTDYSWVMNTILSAAASQW